MPELGARCPAPRAGALVAALVLAASAVAPPAFSHTGGFTGYASIAIEGANVRYGLTLWPSAVPPALAEDLRQTRAGHAAARDRLLGLIRDKVALSAQGQRCAAGPGSVRPPSTVESVTLVVEFRCADAVRDLAIRDDLFDVLGADYHTLARIDARDRTEQFAFTPETRETRVRLDAPDAGTASFVPLGVLHILEGWDHLLFLLALLLRGGPLLSLLKIVTAFTIAHSLTLGLAVLGAVTVPDRFVEAVIAASIAYVALENLVARAAPSRRWLVSFAFGLVHGLGFASALGPLDLPGAALALALLAFNAGVELGQAVVILVALPLLVQLRRRAWEGRIVRVASAALVAVGVVVCVQRLLA